MTRDKKKPLIMSRPYPGGLTSIQDKQFFQLIDQLTAQGAVEFYHSEQFQRVKDNVYQQLLAWPADMDHYDRRGSGLTNLLVALPSDEQIMLVKRWQLGSDNPEFLFSVAVASPMSVVDALFKHPFDTIPALEQLLNGNREIDYPNFPTLALKLRAKLNNSSSDRVPQIKRLLILRWLNYHQDLTAKDRAGNQLVWDELAQLIIELPADDVVTAFYNASNLKLYTSGQCLNYIHQLSALPHPDPSFQHLISQRFITRKNLTGINPLDAIENAIKELENNKITADEYELYRKQSRIMLPAANTIKKLFGDWETALGRVIN